jgi:hypothetical protein
LFYNTPPWAITTNAYASSKTPPENPVGKNGSWRKEYISTAFCIVHVASSKTLCEKPSSKKLTKGKEYNIKPSWLYNYIVTILHE